MQMERAYQMRCQNMALNNIAIAFNTHYMRTYVRTYSQYVRISALLGHGLVKTHRNENSHHKNDLHEIFNPHQVN